MFISSNSSNNNKFCQEKSQKYISPVVVGIVGPRGNSAPPSKASLQFSSGTLFSPFSTIPSEIIVLGMGISSSSNASPFDPDIIFAANSIPFCVDGTLSDFEVSIDESSELATASDAIITFTVAISRVVSNDGTSHISDPFVRSSLNTSISLSTITSPPSDHTATKLNVGVNSTLSVQAGDRIAVTVESSESIEPDRILLFSASLTYTPLF